MRLRATDGNGIYAMSETGTRKDTETMQVTTYLLTDDGRTAVSRHGSRALALILAVIATALAALTVPTAASAALSLDGFSADVVEASGDPETQAGIHPFAATNKIDISLDPDAPPFPPVPSGNIKDVVVDLPVGFVGDPSDLPTCNTVQLTELTCEPSAQVGTLTTTLVLFGLAINVYEGPVFNMEVPEGQPAQFGTEVLAASAVVFFDASVRPDDSGITVTSRNTTHLMPILGTDLEFWGVPALSVHDAQRGWAPSGATPGKCNMDGGTPPCHAGVEPKPFLRNTTQCGEPQVTKVRINSWQDPDTWVEDEFTGPAMTNCDVLDFQPDVKVQPANTTADSPSAYAVEVTQKLNDSPDALATADLKDAVVSLPEGVAVNPAAAGGLETCTEQQIGLGQAGDPACPAHSTIGQVEIDSPTLNETLKGPIYQATQDQNPFGTTLAIYMAPKSDRYGVQLKLAGEIATDPDTGRVTTTFADNPQLPFSKLTMNLKGGNRAVLVNPPTCGQKTTQWSMASWAQPDAPVQGTDTFTIDRAPNGTACAADEASRDFSPSLTAGVANPTAGSSSPFVMRLQRPDGHQELRSVEITPPEGVTGVLRSATQCSDAQAAAGNCPVASQIGTAIAGAGAGSSPYYVGGGEVHLAGPYKGAPLSLLISVPAVAGPFDLGEVNVRAAVHVNPRTAQLRIISDPIPRILEGIPLRVQDLRVAIDKPGFMIAPTDCSPKQIAATAHGYGGSQADLTNRFQVGECASLGFAPNLDLSFGKSKKDTKANAHPELNAKLSFNEGDANIRSVEVALPQGTFLDQDRLGRICSRANYAAETCSKESIVGYAKATTPLLDKPVEGPVYLKASDNTLPDLAADLNGQIDIDLFGKIDQKQNKKGLNQIRNTFDIVPDVPVSDFELTLEGGDEGLLVNSRNICKSRKAQKVSIDMVAHNGMTSSSKPLIGSACKSINKKKASKLKAKAKKLLKKAKKADDKTTAKQLRKQARKLKKQARKLGR